MRLQTDNGDIVFYDDTKFSITKYNVMVNKDNEEFSLNIDTPREQNLRVFGHWYRQSAVRGLHNKIPCNMSIKGKRIFSGIVHLTKPDIDTYEIMLKGCRNEIMTLTVNTSIQNLAWEEQQVDPSSFYKEDMLSAMLTALNGSRKWYAFPVYNKGFRDDTTTKAWANEWDFDNQVFRNHWSVLNTVYPRLCYVLEDFFDLFGYKVEENFLKTDAEWNKLCIWNNIDLVNGPTAWTWGKLLPDMTVAKFLAAVELFTGTTILINSFTRRVKIIQTSTPFNSESINLESKLLHGKTPNIPDNDGYTLKFTGTKNDATLNNEGFYEGENAYLPEVNTYADLPTPSSVYVGSICPVKSLKMYYKCVATDAETPEYYWDPWCGKLDYIKTGENAYNVEIEAFPVLNGRQTKSATVTINSPTQGSHNEPVTMRMDVPEVSVPEDEEIGLRFVFYRGIANAVYNPPVLIDDEVIGAIHPEYPQASYTIYMPDGTTHLGATVELTPAGILALQKRLVEYLAYAQPTDVKIKPGVNEWNMLVSERTYIIEGNEAILESATLNGENGEVKTIEATFLVRTAYNMI